MVPKVCLVDREYPGPYKPMQVTDIRNHELVIDVIVDYKGECWTTKARRVDDPLPKGEDVKNMKASDRDQGIARAVYLVTKMTR